MKKTLKFLVVKIISLIPLKLLEYITSRKFGYPILSYAPDGEDLIIKNLFKGKDKGLYVDIGAHHPIRFSNTHLLYRKGWRGINIDALPGSMREFKRYRPNDTNLEIGISERPSNLDYYMFTEPAYNTFNSTLANDRIKYGLVNTGIIKIQTDSLSNILNRYTDSENAQIDLLNIDVEGYDIQVLKSNDWSKYRPNIIAIEDTDFNIQKPNESDIFNFLTQNGYSLITFCIKTAIYKKQHD